VVTDFHFIRNQVTARVNVDTFAVRHDLPTKSSYDGESEVEIGAWHIQCVFRVNSVVQDLSDLDIHRPRPNERPYVNPFGKRLTMDATCLDPSAHLWREHRFGRELFMSDDLYDRLMQMKVKLPARKVGVINTSENK
jgi:hypothetical protein